MTAIAEPHHLEVLLSSTLINLSLLERKQFVVKIRFSSSSGQRYSKRISPLIKASSTFNTGSY
jgi:hypothetical protein